jgi:hypothetical protein
MDGANDPPAPFQDDDDPPVFVIKRGMVWACWLSGRAPVALGTAVQVTTAMSRFLQGEPAAPPHNPAPASSPSPPAAEPAPPLREEKRSRQESERAEPRHDLSIIGKILTGSGVRDVTIVDLSEQGCRFQDRSCNLRPEMAISVRIGSVGPIRSTVRWRRGEHVGIHFDNPLYPSVLEHIRKHFDVRK